MRFFNTNIELNNKHFKPDNKLNVISLFKKCNIKAKNNFNYGKLLFLSD